jgi:hypothetical protein
MVQPLFLHLPMDDCHFFIVAKIGRNNIVLTCKLLIHDDFPFFDSLKKNHEKD